MQVEGLKKMVRRTLLLHFQAENFSSNAQNAISD
jgi:hypothetical protein